MKEINKLFKNNKYFMPKNFNLKKNDKGNKILSKYIKEKNIKLGKNDIFILNKLISINISKNLIEENTSYSSQELNDEILKASNNEFNKILT